MIFQFLKSENKKFKETITHKRKINILQIQVSNEETLHHSRNLSLVKSTILK